ncbi:MAG TPA: tripartite tricarboxylate transporter substrate binding protein [Burkholderiales bacterium]|nr:tripartite tricarboxylate transporter substrate binding protein [Burkholderiales bacterium]
MTRWLACLAVLVFAGAAAAQPYPSRPVRILIAFAGGGLADIIARTVSERMSPALGQPFVLENRPGAGGNIAMEATARAAPDGHTLLMIGPAAAINGTLYRSLSFNPTKDLAPIGIMGWGPYAMYVSATLPVNSAAEFLAYARERGGRLNYASVGVGSGGHLTGVLFAMAGGLQMTHVPYKGIQAIAPDLVSGEVHLVFNAFGALNAFVQNGKIKQLAATSPTRLPQYPDVPTLAESGLPGFDAAGWYVLFAPAATPRPLLERLNGELRKAIAERDTAEKIEKTGMRPVSQTLDEASRFLAAETDKWGRAVKASGATAD